MYPLNKVYFYTQFFLIKSLFLRNLCTIQKLCYIRDICVSRQIVFQEMLLYVKKTIVYVEMLEDNIDRRTIEWGYAIQSDDIVFSLTKIKKLLC